MDIKNPWDVAADGQFDTISVTFWGTEYFKSLNNREVRYGTVISHKIFRQINPAASKQIDDIDFGDGLFMFGFLFMILPFVTLGSLLPTWMFINALQLLAHLPLLNSIMPANAHYFLNKYLEKVRWYDEDFVKWVDDNHSMKKYDLDTGIFHNLLKACGYEHIFIYNMLLVFAAICLILFVWAGLAIKDLIGQLSDSKNKFMKKRHGRMCNNFALRFFYEFFLEFCIVVFINLSVTDFTEFSPTFSYLASIALIILITGLTLFVISLLFRNGPYVAGYYQKRTAWTKIWGVRPADPEFDVYAYLRQNKAKRKKHRGWFKFVIGNKN